LAVFQFAVGSPVRDSNIIFEQLAVLFSWQVAAYQLAVLFGIPTLFLNSWQFCLLPLAPLAIPLAYLAVSFFTAKGVS